MRYIFSLIIFFVSIPASAIDGEWRVNQSIDSMTDTKIISADVLNASGHSLSIHRKGDGSVWMMFRISEKSTDVLGHQLPVFRVDKEKPFDIELNRSMDKLSREIKKPTVSYSAEPKWVTFKIFHGQGIPDKGPLAQVMSGSNIIFRYYLFTGGYKETGFSLAGAQAVIDSAIFK